VWSLVAQALAGSVVATAVLWGASTWRPRLRASRRHFRELFGFSGYVFGTSVLALVSRRGDDFLIGWVLGPVALGYYVIAYELINALADLLGAVATRVGFPAFSRLQADPARMREWLYAATRYITLLAAPAFVGVMLVAPEFVRVAYGAQWAPSIPVMQVLALLGVLHAAFAIQGTVMLAAGKATWRFAITLIGVVGNIVAFFIAVRWGIVAVAIAYVIRGYLLSPLPVLALHRLIGLELGEYLRQYRTPLLASGLMAAGLLLLETLLEPALPPELLLASMIGSGVVIYAAAVHLQQPHLLRDLARHLQRSPVGVVPTDSGP
jgi:O-antigen/teichoic acid export membrane protein